jgi:peptidoglycan/xylan/chitin deacetylase (PgdA/CDA1 family)
MTLRPKMEGTGVSAGEDARAEPGPRGLDVPVQMERSRGSVLLRSFSMLVVACAVLLATASATTHAATATTVVTLSFDDAWDNQTTAASMLAAHGLTGTFYINSGFIGQSGHLTWDQVDAINAAGNEIGGHSVDHPDLTTLSSTDAQAEICNDRAAIQAHGFIDNDFAYPFGGYDQDTGSGATDVKPLVPACGYASGRAAFGLHSITATNDTAPYATSIPPPNVYTIWPACCINWASNGNSTPTAAELENYVQHAEAGGGGWVNFFFHRLCDNCGEDTPAPSMSPSEFDAFLGWLQANANNVTVQTVAQVLTDDSTPPSSSIACGGSSCSSGWSTGPVSVSLSATDGGSGVAMIHYTTDGSDPTVASPTYSDPITVSSTTTVKYRAWDKTGNVESTKSQTIQIDTTPPSSSIGCNGSSCSSGWYNAAVTVSLSATDGQSGAASIHYTTDGTDPTLNSLTYLGPFTVSSTTTVKYRAWDNVGNAEPTKSQTIQIDTTPPAPSIACNGSTCSGWYRAVTVSLSATDGQSGVASIHYTTDGSTPTLSSPTYTGQFSVSATTTVKYKAWDNAGNASATASQTVSIDTIAPTVAITSPANGATVGGNITVSASAGDSGGSGVATVSFYLDGRLLSTQRGPKYSFQWNTKSAGKGQHTLTAVATDNAGNTTTSAAVTVTVK